MGRWTSCWCQTLREVYRSSLTNGRDSVLVGGQAAVRTSAPCRRTESEGERGPCRGGQWCGTRSPRPPRGRRPCPLVPWPLSELRRVVEVCPIKSESDSLSTSADGRGEEQACPNQNSDVFQGSQIPRALLRGREGPWGPAASSSHGPR